MKNLVPFASAMLLVACTEPSQNTRAFHGFNPLAQPKGTLPLTPTASSGFTGGQFVFTATPQTGFFKQLPTSDATANRLLPLDASVKVLSQNDPFTQVELDNGEIGWILTSQLSHATATPALAPLPPSAPTTKPSSELIPSTIEP